MEVSMDKSCSSTKGNSLVHRFSRWNTARVSGRIQYRGRHSRIRRRGAGSGCFVMYDVDRRVVVYPAYINKALTQSQGRKIKAELACSDPTAGEIFDCVKHLGLPCEVERAKAYSREWWIRGRVRVKLKEDNGAPVVSSIPTRKALFLEIAKLLPRHPNRVAPKEKEPAPSGSSSNKGKQGKKGKKGRK